MQSMALTQAQIAALRAAIGPETPAVDDTELFRIYTRHGGSLTATALEVLDARIASLATGGPLSFTVPGEYSEDRGKNLDALQKIRDRVAAQGITGDEATGVGTVTVVSTRRDWSR